MGDSQITDIHAHVLPGIDDGPETMDESIELLKLFMERGIDRVICTSHFLSPHFEVSLESIRQGYETLAAAPEPGIMLSKGAELRITSSLVNVIQDEQIPTLGDSRYVLVEFRSDVIAQRSLELIHELVVRDYQPIMAHPERNLGIQKDPSLLGDLVDAGLLFQLTAWCFDKPSRQQHAADKLAWRILEDGLATVIASDAHNTTTRPPGLLEAYDNIASRLGQSVTDTLIANANAIWDGRPVEQVTVTQTKRSVLRALFR